MKSTTNCTANDQNKTASVIRNKVSNVNKSWTEIVTSQPHYLHVAFFERAALIFSIYPDIIKLFGYNTIFCSKRCLVNIFFDNICILLNKKIGLTIPLKRLIQNPELTVDGQIIESYICVRSSKVRIAKVILFMINTFPTKSAHTSPGKKV